MNCMLYGSEILAVLLFIPWSAYAEDSTHVHTPSSSQEPTISSVTSKVTSFDGSLSTVSTMSPEKKESVSMKKTSSVSPTQQPIQTVRPPATPFLKKECLEVFLVCGGLILVCTLLMITTLLLTWKVCQLHRHINMMSSNTELWMETKNQCVRSEQETEAKETTVLMADLGQTNQEMKNGSAKEDGEKVKEDGQTGEEKEKEEEEEENTNTKKASAAVESSSPSKPQEDAGSSLPTAAAATSSSEVTEEPKDVP